MDIVRTSYGHRTDMADIVRTSYIPLFKCLIALTARESATASARGALAFMRHDRQLEFLCALPSLLILTLLITLI